ncbi:MAG: permease, partial [Bdellovibrionales bacterium]|nr:permease [Bdellovibrionales bacterium]
LVERKHLPENKSRVEISSDFDFKLELKKIFSKLSLNPLLSLKALRNGFEESLMIIRWIMVGVIITALIRAFVPMDFFQNYFGPSVLGLGLTLIAATIIEVCSEGSVPIAADLLSRAHAPGNAFTFLMAGVATDYTEILAIKETTKSWKISLMLPLVTVPQILIISYLLNF